MNQNQVTVTEAVLAAYFSGKATPEEKGAIDKWRLLSPENESLFRDYALIWDKAGRFEPVLHIDRDKAFARIVQKTEQPVRSFGISRNLRYFTRIAAVAVLLIVALLIFRQPREAYHDQFTLATVENQEVHLADGSVVWLRGGSTLAYHAGDDGRSPRHVRLIGDGYFEVAHNPDRPFSVELDGGERIEVLGTEFNVTQSGKDIAVLVKSGKVRFSPGEGDFPVLTASQKAVYSKEDSRLTISEVHTMNELSWHTGGLEFVSTPLSRVIQDLEKYFQVKIILENSALNSCLHTAPLTNSSLEEVLGALEVAYGLKVNKISAREYRLSGGYCGR